jgi:hypothetical protein
MNLYAHPRSTDIASAKNAKNQDGPADSNATASAPKATPKPKEFQSPGPQSSG